MNNSLKLTNEIEVGSSPDGSFRLTNLRVQHYKSSLGTETFISIMLEKISSVATVYTSYILYLVIGILLEAIGVMLLASSSRSENNGAVETEWQCFWLNHRASDKDIFSPIEYCHPIQVLNLHRKVLAQGK